MDVVLKLHKETKVVLPRWMAFVSSDDIYYLLLSEATWDLSRNEIRVYSHDLVAGRDEPD